MRPGFGAVRRGTGVTRLGFRDGLRVASVGLRVLMVAAKQARARNGTVAVAALQPVVREIFEISKFTMVLPTFPSVRDALGELSKPAQAAFDAVR